MTAIEPHESDPVKLKRYRGGRKRPFRPRGHRAIIEAAIHRHPRVQAGQRRGLTGERPPSRTVSQHVKAVKGSSAHTLRRPANWSTACPTVQDISTRKVGSHCRAVISEFRVVSAPRIDRPSVRRHSRLEGGGDLEPDHLGGFEPALIAEYGVETGFPARSTWKSGMAGSPCAAGSRWRRRTPTGCRMLRYQCTASSSRRTPSASSDSTLLPPSAKRTVRLRIAAEGLATAESWTGPCVR